MTNRDVSKGPGKGEDARMPSQAGRRCPARARAKLLPTADPEAEGLRAVRADIDHILDELDEAALFNALDAIKLCRYGMEFQRKTPGMPDRVPTDLPTSGETRIERSSDGSGSTYHLISGSSWKILAAEEIAALLRIVRHTENEAAAAKRLWQWFRQERRDIALDLGLEKATSSGLFVILHVLKETFPVMAPRRLP